MNQPPGNPEERKINSQELVGKYDRESIVDKLQNIGSDDVVYIDQALTKAGYDFEQVITCISDKDLLSEDEELSFGREVSQLLAEFKYTTFSSKSEELKIKKDIATRLATLIKNKFD